MLIERQGLFFELLKNSHQKGKFAHCYLLTGSDRSPLMEAAQYFTKTLLCDTFPPCLNCQTCHLIDVDQHPDFYHLSCKEEKLKVDQVELIRDRFFLGSAGRSGKSVLVISDVDNATPQALNKMLKFIEEPTDGIYIILTSEQVANVLPTILSRAQVVTITPASPMEIAQMAMKQGVKEDDAHILSQFIAAAPAIVELSSSEKYLLIKGLLEEYLAEPANEQLALFLQLKVAPVLDDAPSFNLFLNLLELIYKDIFRLEMGTCAIIFKAWEEKLLKRVPEQRASRALEAIATIRKMSQLNTARVMLIDKLADQITR